MKVDNDSAMVLLYPWFLLLLLPVAIASIFALFRPARRLVKVSSLRIWQEVIEAVGGSAGQASKKIDLIWIMILTGLVFAVLALCHPVCYFSAPSRCVAIEFAPTLETATDKAMAEFRTAASLILNRLSDNDRVVLLRPVSADTVQSTGYMSPDDVLNEIEGIAPSLIPGDRIVFPPVGGEVQHTYRIVSAATEQEESTNRSIVYISTDLPAVTLDSLTAHVSGSEVDVLAILNCSEMSLASGLLVNFAPVTAYTRENGPVTGRVISKKTGDAGTNGRFSVDGRVPVAPAIRVDVVTEDGQLMVRSFLVRRKQQAVPVAIVGRDEPMIRRYIESDPMLILVGDMANAAVVVANGVEPPDGIPAVVICPPDCPGSFLSGNKVLEDIVLDDADFRFSDPILEDVVPGHMAVRRATPWRAGPNSVGRILASIGDQILIMRTTPEQETISGKPQRVFFAFQLSAENTNMVASESFVVLMANVFRYLASTRIGSTVYTHTGLHEIYDHTDWTLLAKSNSAIFSPVNVGDLPLPGLYVDENDILHSVVATGLRSATATVPGEEIARSVPVPAAVHNKDGVRIYPYLVALALFCWLFSWIVRNSG